MKGERAMTPTTTVPFTITDDAVALLRELGFQKEFDQIIEQLKQFVPGLLSISVRVMIMYDEGNRPIVLIEGEFLDRHLEDDPTQRQWGELFSLSFPPEVREHFGVLLLFGGPNAR
jgi:hypothetical protein